MEVEFLRAHADLESSSKVLDVACGNGRHLIGLALHICRGIGIDSNEDFIRSARQKSSARGLTNLVFEHRDARSPGTRLRFDHVLMLNGILGVFGEEGDTKIILISPQAQIHISRYIQ